MMCAPPPAGKDRTGLLAMLLLLLCDVERQVGGCEAGAPTCVALDEALRLAHPPPSSPHLLLFPPSHQAVITDYALSEALLRESREKRELLGFQEHLTTDQAR